MGRHADPATARTPHFAARPWRDCTGADDRARWADLAARAAEPNPFFESWYLLPALTAFDPAARVRLMVLEQDGQWLGLLPIVRERHYYRYPVPQMRNWVHANCFLGAPLVAAGHEDAFWRALLGHADQAGGASLFLHLTQMPLDGPLLRALQSVVAQQGRTIALVHREDRALLASSLTPEAYLEASLTGKKRKELRRQYARLSEAGELAFTRQHDEAGLGEWIETFLALEASGWKGTAGSALACAPETVRLFRQGLAGGAAARRLERLTLTLDGRAIAMLASFIAPPGAFSFKTAFDEAYARFSPGVLLQRENLALLEHEGIAWCDSCASADHPMIDHLWRERRPIGRVSLAIGGTLRRALFHRLVSAELGRRPVGVMP